MVAVYIGIIMLMRVVQSILNKRTARLLPRNAAGYLRYTAYYQGLAGLIAAVVMAIPLIRGASVNAIGMTILYASLSGIALGISCILGKYLLNLTTMALTSIFSTAGLLIPSVASIFLFGETMLWYQWIAIAVFMVGAYLLIGNSKKIYKKFTVKTLLLLLLHFGMNGLTMLMQKIFGMRVEGGNASLFSFVTFASGVAVALVTLIVLSIAATAVAKSKKTVLPAVVAEAAAQPAPTETVDPAAEVAATEPEATAETETAEVAATAAETVAATSQEVCVQKSEEPFRFLVTDKQAKKLPKAVYWYGAALAAAVFLINQLATLSTPLISSVILFTLINGGATVISAVVGAVLYKEKISIKGAIGLVLSIGALVLVQI